MTRMGITRIEIATVLCSMIALCPYGIDAYVPTFMLSRSGVPRVGKGTVQRRNENNNKKNINNDRISKTAAGGSTSVKLRTMTMMMSPFPIEEAASAWSSTVESLVRGDDVPRILSSMSIAAALDGGASGEAASIPAVDIQSLPAEVAVPLSEYFTQKHEEFSYMDIMAKVPLAASVLAIFDFAINRLLVDDVEENLRQEEMDGDSAAQTNFFLTRLGIRVAAIIAVSFGTVLISKLTYDNPF